MIEPLKAVSNIIELKEGKKYLLVIKSEQITAQQLIELTAVIRESGIQSIGIALRDGEELEVIEMPGESHE